MSWRTKLVVAYLGDPFAGWQRQPGQTTVQETVEKALERVTGSDGISVVGAGRTDAGVHAAGQVAHADLPARIPGDDLRRALNAALPDSVRIRRVTAVRPEFHARYDALAKRYVYRASWRPSTVPWRHLRTATLRPPVDPDALEKVVALLAGRHDVSSFAPPSEAHRSPERTLHGVDVRRSEHGVRLTFVGDGFLRYQVRRMVGAAFQVAWGQRSLEGFRRLLEQPTPGARLWTAPARGLTLERVFYPGDERALADGVRTFLPVVDSPVLRPT